MLLSPTVIEPKLIDAGKSVAVGTAALPLPLKVMVCVPPAALSFTVKVAERDPVAPGVKVTEIRHVASGLMLPDLGHVLAVVILKSPGFAPVNVLLVMLRATVALVSVSVEVSAELVVPWVMEPKFSDFGNSVAVGTAAAPVPLKLMV